MTLAPAVQRNNRGVYSCGVCGQIGHTRKVCPSALSRITVSGFKASNGDYATNRTLRACDDCGAPSERSRCPACSERRKTWPSRQREADLARRPWRNRGILKCGNCRETGHIRPSCPHPERPP